MNYENYNYEEDEEEKEPNTTCLICGTPYYVCPDCQNQDIPSWRLITDTPDCYKIHFTLESYFSGLTTRQEAKESLKNIDLSNLSNFRDFIQNAINFIMK